MCGATRFMPAPLTKVSRSGPRSLRPSRNAKKRSAADASIDHRAVQPRLPPPTLERSDCAYCYDVLQQHQEPKVPPSFLRRAPRGGGDVEVTWTLDKVVRKSGKVLLFYSHTGVLPGIAADVVVKCSVSRREVDHLNLLLGRLEAVEKLWYPRIPYCLPYAMARHRDGAATHIVMPNCGITLKEFFERTKLEPSDALGLTFMIAFAIESICSLGWCITDLHDENFVVHELKHPVSLRYTELEPTNKGTLKCSTWISRTRFLVFMIDAESVCYTHRCFA